MMGHIHRLLKFWVKITSDDPDMNPPVVDKKGGPADWPKRVRSFQVIIYMYITAWL